MEPPLRIVAACDLHGILPAIPTCDLLLLGGDLCPDGNAVQQARWLDGPFRAWLREVPTQETVAVAGNHDFLFENAPQLVPTLKWHYLQDSGVELFGFKLWGTPWQPVFYDWAFNLKEADLARKWKLIPTDTDILLLHGPPFGFGDRNLQGEHTGSPSLTRRIEVVQPALVICGHIHEARGEYRIRQSRVINASQLDVRYQPYSEVCELRLERSAAKSTSTPPPEK